MKVYCPQCHATREMEAVAKTLPWGFELICRCLACHQKFLVDFDSYEIRWMLDYPPTDRERAKYNRQVITNQWFIEGYLAVEQWLEENPYAEWREPGGRYERSGNSFHEQALGKSGVNCPEGRI